MQKNFARCTYYKFNILHQKKLLMSIHGTTQDRTLHWENEDVEQLLDGTPAGIEGNITRGSIYFWSDI